jgi:hypothetical protein
MCTNPHTIFLEVYTSIQTLFPEGHTSTQILFPEGHTSTQIFSPEGCTSTQTLFLEGNTSTLTLFPKDIRVQRHFPLMGTNPHILLPEVYTSTQTLFPVSQEGTEPFHCTKVSHLPAHAVYWSTIKRRRLRLSVLFLSHLTVPSSLMKCLMEAVKVHSQGWSELCIPHRLA